MSQRTCDQPDCTNPHLARGLCRLHWKRTYGKPTRYTIECIVCGAKHQSSRADGRFCSDACKGKHYETTRKTRCILPADHPVRAEMQKIREAARPLKRAAIQPVWVSGPCGWCGTGFTTYTFSGSARYCSTYCGKRAGKARRRASEAGADGTYTWSEVTRLWISIGKRCAYCDQPKRNDEIEPDHVEPLSKGGSNSITNVVPSCSPCNGDKRDLALTDWYADRERRGLEPRLLHPLLTHLTSTCAA